MPATAVAVTALLGREHVPALSAHPDVLYLDNASTTQKPHRVVDAVHRHLTDAPANPGRGSYPWATRAAATLEAARERVAGFIGAGTNRDVVFTAGATASLHAVATSWGWNALQDGDEILYSPANHASNVYPWVRLRQALARSGRRVQLVPYRFTPGGEVDVDDLAAKLSPRTRLLAVPHVHHVFGGLTTLEELRGRIPDRVRTCFDCSQSIGHLPVDVRALGADFAVFSAHKMLGLPGTGVLYCAPRVHGELGPFLPGGGSAVELSSDGLTVTDLPYGLEGGTPNLVGIVALAEAVDVLEDVGIDRIAAHGRDLTRSLLAGLGGIRGVRMLPGPAWCPAPTGHGIVSFAVDGLRADDLGFALAAAGCFVRAGQHCLPGAREHENSLRVSVHLYTSAEDVDAFLSLLDSLLDHVTTGVA